MVSISRSSISTYSRAAFSDFVFLLLSQFCSRASSLSLFFWTFPSVSRRLSADCRALARHSSETVCSCFLKLAFCSSSCLCLLSSGSRWDAFSSSELLLEPVLHLLQRSVVDCVVLLQFLLEVGLHSFKFLPALEPPLAPFHCFSVGSLLPLLNGVTQLLLFLSKLLFQLVDVAPISSGADSFPAEAARVPTATSVSRPSHSV